MALKGDSYTTRVDAFQLAARSYAGDKQGEIK